MKRKWMVAMMLVLAGSLLMAGAGVLAQDAAKPAAAAPAAPAAAVTKPAPGGALPAGATLDDEAAADDKKPAGGDFISVILSSGVWGVILWAGLLATSIAGVYLIIDSFVKIRARKIMPPELVKKVREAMEQGDLSKALEFCKKEPGVMSNILMAGFSNVEEGFDVIQDSINATADLESEKLMQKVTYLSVVSNLAPMLGLAGTVQGMIWAFDTLATTQAGAAQQAMLALSISQALYTTIAGLGVAVPTVAFFYYFRNRANNIILNMIITTIDLIKALRNVEVVEE